MGAGCRPRSSAHRDYLSEVPRVTSHSGETAGGPRVQPRQSDEPFRVASGVRKTAKRTLPIGCHETERVPALCAPGVTNAVLLEHHGIDRWPLQIVADGQSGLACTGDEDRYVVVHASASKARAHRARRISGVLSVSPASYQGVSAPLRPERTRPRTLDYSSWGARVSSCCREPDLRGCPCLPAAVRDKPAKLRPPMRKARQGARVQLKRRPCAKLKLLRFRRLLMPKQSRTPLPPSGRRKRRIRSSCIAATRSCDAATESRSLPRQALLPAGVRAAAELFSSLQ